MSYTFSVSYQNVVKKVLCGRSATVNDVLRASFDKFNILLSNSGELSSGGKKLDALLPVRHTNLVNNAKLVLLVTKGAAEVTLKVTASVKEESVTKILKIASAATLAALVAKFREAAGIEADWTDQRIQLSVLQAVKDNLSSDFAEVTVASLVGSSTNAVIRMVVENRDRQLQRAKLQEDQKILRQQYEEKQRQNRLLQKQQQELEAQRLREAKRAEDEAKDSMEIEPEENASREVVSKSQTSDPEPPVVKHNEQTVETPAVPSNLATTNVSSTSMVSPSHPRESFHVPEEKEDTLYIPNERTALYENPEEDYNMTMGQAEKYLKIIKSMQGGPSTKKETMIPQKYVIRIRFPDRSLLDLPIEDASMKLGQLLKKVDGYVDERFINSYKLKNGLPPFKEIAIGFTENNLPLKSHPDFQQEKLVLIWEPAVPKASGPFLKQGIASKDASELPTMLLETNRGKLEKDVATVPAPLHTNTTTKKSTPGVPKWFRR